MTRESLKFGSVEAPRVQCQWEKGIKKEIGRNKKEDWRDRKTGKQKKQEKTEDKVKKEKNEEKDEEKEEETMNENTPQYQGGPYGEFLYLTKGKKNFWPGIMLLRFDSVF